MRVVPVFVVVAALELLGCGGADDTPPIVTTMAGDTNTVTPLPCAAPGLDPHTDANGVLQCCNTSSSTAVWCPPRSGFPGACIPQDADCATALLCGARVGTCAVGQVPTCDPTDSTTHCCPSATPGWCAESTKASGKLSAGFCTIAKPDCATKTQCPGHTELAACPFGATPHCASDGSLACCGIVNPIFCAKTNASPVGFVGQCFQSGALCSTVGLTADGTYIACNQGESAALTAKALTHCCGGATPVVCPVHAGTDATYDGTGCFPADTNCDSLTHRKSGGWDSCKSGQSFGVTSDGVLQCCPADKPKFCPPGTLLDGDAAIAASIAAKPIAKDGASECKTTADCAVAGGPPMNCESTANDPYNQCIASPKAFAAPYPGGCWPATQDCTRLYRCGQQLLGCAQPNCYCWEGELFGPW